jgi:DNA-binding beta-propeller fold protein YncE
MIARQRKWSLRALSVALLGLCALALTSVPASAEFTRSFEGSFTGAEAPEGPFVVISSVAVDTAGDVYVAGWNSNYHSVVDEFDASGSYIGVQITAADTPQPSFSVFRPNEHFGGIAVDSSGSVYVADVKNNLVDRFSSSGVFECQITGKTPVSAEEIAHECNGAAGSETPNDGFEPTGVAVSSTTGDVYVADSGHDVIDEFGPDGKYITQISSPELALSEVAPIALDSSGDLYVTNVGSDVVEFDAAGAFVSVLDSGGHPEGVAVDPVTGHVDVYDYSEQRIAEYEPDTDALLGRFGAGDFKSKGEAQVFGLATGPTGKLYAGEVEGQLPVLNIFGAEFVVPAVTTGKATGVGQTAATLNGEVEPDAAHGGETTACEFEYVTEAHYQEHSADPYEGAATAQCEPPASPSTPYKAPTDVSANITLAPDTTYHFRLRAANANAVTRYGQDEILTTYGPPAIDGESATELTISAMTLEARIDPFGYDTTCEVQYADEAEFESSGYASATTLPCVPADLGSGFGDQSTGATLSGLQLATTYHYRFIAINGAGMVPGADETFATFGLESFSFGVFSAQAGAHSDLTDSFALNTSPDLFDRPGTELNFGAHGADANPKEVQTELPPGLIGDPDATPKCSPYHVERRECSDAEQVGVITVIDTRNGFVEPLYNVVPPAGVAAQFGAEISTFGAAYIDATVRSGGDYGVTADSSGISADEGIHTVSVTLWGVPADPSHTPERRCAGTSNNGCASEAELKPFLTNPTSCSGPLKTTMRVDSWQAPTSFAQAVSEMAGMTGCERLHFTPTIAVTPESTSSDSPTGLSVDLHVPQNEDPAGLAEADLRDALVTLPEGVTVNPSGAYGRQGCSPAQIELHGPEPAQCPDASKIGSVQIETPLLEHPLEGGVYLAQQGNAGPAQGANPFGSLLAIYIAAENAERGVVVKLAGEVAVDPQTGRLTTTFDENPQLPFEELNLDLFGGSRAPLSTPQACGVYTTTTSLTPWSAPESGPAATPSSTFPISSGPGGSPCAAQGFAPSFTAGTSNNQAGAFSPFALKLARQDGEQTLSTVSTRMPPGLLGMLSKVALCGEPQAKEGTCPAASQIGHVTASAGVGSEPLTLPEAGRPQDPVYLTGPYDGAPFGLSIVVPAESGPFNLGTVVVRAAIHIDPATSQISVASEPMPTRLQGIPLDVRSVEVTIDREGFMFNPTDCEPLAVTGTIGSAQGAAASVSNRYEAANCATLPFVPSFTASTQAKTSKVNGASLVVKVTQKPGEANIAKVELQLPKVLPSRNSTLQKACTEAQFNANPAGCPAGSVIGTATARTPVLQVPLTGPAYLVSHGGAAFPDVEYVLQADERGGEVEIVLDGKTQIKSGITYSRFETVPDAPISSFETDLPEGPHSIFSTENPGSTNLCAVSLLMPITIVGQNGAVEEHEPRIEVTGCRDALSISSRSLKNRTLTLHVVVPAAGKLTASGRGLKPISKSAAGRETLTLTVGQKHAGRLSTKVKLSFEPSNGRKLAKALSVTFTR